MKQHASPGGRRHGHAPGAMRLHASQSFSGAKHCSGTQRGSCIALRIQRTKTKHRLRQDRPAPGKLIGRATLAEVLRWSLRHVVESSRRCKAWCADRKAGSGQYRIRHITRKQHSDSLQGGTYTGQWCDTYSFSGAKHCSGTRRDSCLALRIQSTKTKHRLRQD